MSLFALWSIYFPFIFGGRKAFIDPKARYKKVDKEFMVSVYIVSW